MKLGRRSLALVLAVLVATIAAGCGSRSLGGDELILGYIGWDENVANSNLIKVILKDEFGYEDVQLQLTDVEGVFEGLAEGEIDAFLDIWMPNLQSYMKEVEGKVELSKEPWYLDKTTYGIAVPDYMDVRSIGDLNASGVGMITGIEPGAVLMQRINEQVIPAYDLNLKLVEADTPAMLAELERAYRMKEPIVFLMWSPHWINQEYEFHYLEDPKNAMGSLDEPSRLLAAFRSGFSEDDPVAYALIDAMRLTEDQVGSLELAINEAGDPEKGARDWLKQNREVVRPWIEAAKRAQ